MVPRARTDPRSALNARLRKLARRRPALPTWLRYWHALAGLVVAQWLCVVGFALTVRHNGWFYYQGGDQIWNYTSGWLLGRGQLPTTQIGYGWPLVLAPISWVAGPGFVSALPAVIVLNMLLLGPVALLCMAGIGRRLGGRALGLLAAVLWVLAPWLGVLYINAGYHQRWTEEFLPQVLGLTAMPDFPSMVALLVAAYFALRAVETEAVVDGVVAGLAAGAGAAIKPSNLIFMPLPLIALAVARRWRALLPYALGVVPALLTLAIWKERGLGHVPAFGAAPPRRVALAAGSIFSPLHHYIHLDWHHLHENLLAIREHFWSVRPLEWLAFAGVIALARRSLAAAVLIGGWFFSYLIIKGTYAFASVQDGSFFRYLMPALPAYLLLATALPLLVPVGGARLLARTTRPVPLPLPRRRWILPAIAAALAIVPMIGIAAAAPLRGAAPRAYEWTNILTPTTSTVRPTAQARPAGIVLHWRRATPAAAGVFYRVLRAPAGQDSTCNANGGSELCVLNMEVIGATRGSTWLDPAPTGRWTYRIGVAANWLDDVTQGDVYLLSTPVTLSIS